METEFYKYQGAGNDFIILDDRAHKFNELDHDLVQKLCSRRFGIGADGLMLLRSHRDYDFEMLYFNADGHPGSMCGNGGRCIVAFAHSIGLFDSKTDFLAVDGVHYAEYVAAAGLVKLGMIEVDQIVLWEDAEHASGNGYYLNTGSPHLVVKMRYPELKNLDVVKEGGRLRHHVDFVSGGGTNVNFAASGMEPAGYFVRTFERGVEDETLACGTGATAVALAMAYQEDPFGTGNRETPVKVMGGDLKIYYHQDGGKFSDIYLEGPAVQVFSGRIRL